MEGQFFPGRQRGSFIVHGGDGFHYNVREVRRNKVRLQCRHSKSNHRGCPGTAKLYLDSNQLYHISPHNHGPDPLRQQDMQLRKEILREAERNVSGTKLRAILDRFKLGVANVELASRFTNVRMHSAMYAARSANYPKIPQTLIYLGVLLGQPNLRPLCRTIDGEDFIFRGVVGCIQRKTISLIFISGRMLRFLGTPENIHADGTFKKRPRKPKISQIFNIVTNYNGVVIAVARVLMMRRTEEAYMEVLTYLKTLAPTMAPARIHSDFERGMMNAFKVSFPQSRVVGCLWHFAVAFSRHCRKLGLQPLAEENEEVHGFSRCLAGIPLLPADIMWNGVVQIWEEILNAGLDQLFLPVFQYIETEWKPRRYEMSCFDVPERTNNCSESDNRHMANIIPQQRPNIWDLVGGFVKLEYLSWSDKIAVQDLRAVTNTRRYSAILNDRRVERAASLLRRGQSTPAQFLHQASFAVLAPVNYGLRIHPDESDNSDAD